MLHLSAAWGALAGVLGVERGQQGAGDLQDLCHGQEQRLW